MSLLTGATIRSKRTAPYKSLSTSPIVLSIPQLNSSRQAAQVRMTKTHSLQLFFFTPDQIFEFNWEKNLLTIEITKGDLEHEIH